jgi:hypothetical protein
LLAALKESGSVDVPVERGAAANLVFLDDLLRVAPADEVGFDVVALLNDATAARRDFLELAG